MTAIQQGWERGRSVFDVPAAAHPGPGPGAATETGTGNGADAEAGNGATATPGQDAGTDGARRAGASDRGQGDQWLALGGVAG